MTTRDPRTQAFLDYINSYNSDKSIMGRHIQDCATSLYSSLRDAINDNIPLATIHKIIADLTYITLTGSHP